MGVLQGRAGPIPEVFHIKLVDQVFFIFADGGKDLGTSWSLLAEDSVTASALGFDQRPSDDVRGQVGQRSSMSAFQYRREKKVPSFKGQGGLAGPAKSVCSETMGAGRVRPATTVLYIL